MPCLLWDHVCSLLSCRGRRGELCHLWRHGSREEPYLLQGRACTFHSPLELRPLTQPRLKPANSEASNIIILWRSSPEQLLWTHSWWRLVTCASRAQLYNHTRSSFLVLCAVTLDKNRRISLPVDRIKGQSKIAQSFSKLHHLICPPVSSDLLQTRNHLL